MIKYEEARKYKHYLKSLERNGWIEKKDEEYWILKRDYDKYREVECAYWMAFKEIRRINTVDLENEDFIRVLLECGIIEPTYKIVVPREYYKIMSEKFGNYWLDEEE